MLKGNLYMKPLPCVLGGGGGLTTGGMLLVEGLQVRGAQLSAELGSHGCSRAGSDTRPGTVCGGASRESCPAARSKSTPGPSEDPQAPLARGCSAVPSRTAHSLVPEGREGMAPFPAST